MTRWDQSFEAFPGGNDFGSVSCIAIRRLLTEFYTRLTKEHSITEGISPVVVHIPGQAGVCAIDPGVPNTSGIQGAISLDSDTGRLYLDDGSLMSTISGLDHALYTLDALAEDAHTQYLLANAAAGFDTFTGVLTCLRVSGMDILEADYLGDNTLIVSRGAHKGESASGGAKHANDTIDLTGSGFKPGQDKLKVQEATLYNAAMNNGDFTGELSLGKRAFFPYLDNASSDLAEVKVLPAFIDSAAAFPSGAVTPKLNFMAIHTGAGLVVKINISRISEV